VPVLSCSPIGGHLGATVTGVDLRRLDDETTAQVRSLLLEHLVLFFPGQGLDDDEHLAFALRFGRPYLHPLGRAAGRTEPRAEHIVDDAEHPPFQDRWHTDVSWDAEPPAIGTLRAIDLPDRGGDTMWASMYAAHDTLSPTMQRMLEGLTALHTMGDGRAFKSKGGEAMTAAAAQLAPGAEHPVVVTHPETGRRALYVNRGFTQSIVGLHPAESRALLDLLLAHAEQPKLALRHHWTVGEVAMWDERATLHNAVADHYPRRREMARVAVV